MRPRQLAFDLPGKVALGPEDYFVSPANRAAFELVMAPARWPAAKLMLVGPSGSGKSHLARVFAEVSGAEVVLAAALPEALPAPRARLAVEDLQHLPAGAEERLFHLHNHLAATGGLLLLSADKAPPELPLRLADLRSRLEAAMLIRLPEPDDALLSALLLKLFADRQLLPPPELVAWLAARIERSYAAAAATVALLDAAALEERRSLTVAFAREVLDPAGPGSV